MKVRTEIFRPASNLFPLLFVKQLSDPPDGQFILKKLFYIGRFQSKINWITQSLGSIVCLANTISKGQDIEITGDDQDNDGGGCDDDGNFDDQDSKFQLINNIIEGQQLKNSLIYSENICCLGVTLQNSIQYSFSSIQYN
ncbi:hypothetical protein ACTA71_005937 [Dictyostelium dimigraforme]